MSMNIAPAYAGELEYTSYTELKSSCARHGVRIPISSIQLFQGKTVNTNTHIPQSRISTSHCALDKDCM